MDINIDTQPLKGQTVLITGAARRLGNFMALTLSKAGCNVIVHYNNSKEQAEALVKAVQQIGSKAWLVGADISTEKGLLQLSEDAFSITPVTAIINNASIFTNETFSETTLSTWQENLQVNLHLIVDSEQMFP